MEIKHDKEADALYIEFSKDKFSKNKKIDNNTILDLNDKNEILGIEILDVSKRIPKESLKECNLLS